MPAFGYPATVPRLGAGGWLSCCSPSSFMMAHGLSHLFQAFVDQLNGSRAADLMIPRDVFKCHGRTAKEPAMNQRTLAPAQKPESGPKRFSVRDRLLK